jgi:putative membrane protein
MERFAVFKPGSLNMKIALLAGIALTLGVSGTAEAQSVSSTKFVAKAGASDKFEIESAKLETASSNPAIAKFANQMITDHTKSTQMVKQAAMADKLTPKPPMLDAKQTKDLATLRAANGAARDTLYVSQQKMAHAQALNLMQSYASSGTAANLKGAAGQIVPVVKMHKDMIDKM